MWWVQEIKRYKDQYTILVVAIVLFLSLMTAYSLKDFWHDEAFQYLYSQKPTEFILDSNDVHPPLFNLITKGFMKLGIDTIDEIRLIMVLFGFFFLLQLYYTAKTFYNKEIALYSLIIASLVPTVAYYSIEFRSYILTMAIAIIHIRYFKKTLQNPNKWAVWGFIVSGAIIVYLHYLSGILLICEAIFIISEKRLKQFWAYFVGIAFLLTPLFSYTLNMLGKIQSFWFKDITIISLFSSFTYLFTKPSGFWALYWIVAIISLYFAFKGKYIHPRSKQNLKLFALYIFLPPILMWLISVTIFPFYHHRYFLFGGVMLFILLGYSIYRIKQYYQDQHLAVIGAFIVLALFSFLHIEYDTPLKDSVYFLQNHTLYDDDTVFIHTSTFSQSPYKVYLPRNEHLLLTNLSKKQLFTAGGSVIDFEKEVNYTLPKFTEVYYVSEQYFNGSLIYDQDGLRITKVIT